jgi:hypothetical protein
MIPHWSVQVNRILKPVIFLFAAIYFLVDAILLSVAKLFPTGSPSIGYLKAFAPGLSCMRPYPTLLLFAVPIIVLEPVKPAGRRIWSARVASQWA